MQMAFNSLTIKRSKAEKQRQLMSFTGLDIISTIL